MKKLLEIIANIKKDVGKRELNLSNEEKDKINSDILRLTTTDFNILFDELFKDSNNFNNDFYKIVSELQFYFGFREKSNTVFSKFWIHAYQELLQENEKEDFLNEIFSKDTRYFWNFITLLPEFCTNVELPSSIAAKWFQKLSERVKGDLAGYNVYDSVEKYTLAFPASALEIFNIYEKSLSDENIRTLGSMVLGILRYKKPKSIQDIDKHLKASGNSDERYCYYNSIFLTYKYKAITITQLSQLLDQMLNDESEEIRNLAYSTVDKGLTQIKDFAIFGIEWFDRNCTESISDNSKYTVISCMWRNCSRGENNNINYLDANRIIAKILPVPNEHLGTLEELSNYLCYGIKGANELTVTIQEFLPNGIKNLLCLLKNDRFDHFRSEISKLDLTSLITELIFTGDSKKCKLGFLLLDYAKITPYTVKTLTRVNEEKLQVVLNQFARERNINQTIAKKIQLIEPFFRSASNTLQNDFVDAIVFHAVNYSQSCLKKIKKFGRSKLLKSAITLSEEYFENYEKVKKSPANGFDFPGYKEACIQANKRINIKVQKMAEEKSVFMSLVSKVQLIYGNKFSFTVNGSVSDSSPMAQFEHSMELPRLELIDPEGMAIRRITGV